MVYDDDMADSPHQYIGISDRWPVDVGDVQPALLGQIILVAERHPDWKPERIYDEMRHTGHQVTLDVIYYALSYNWQTGG